MTDIPPSDPDRDRSRSPLGFDELIAMFVAFLSLGGVFFWIVSRRPNLGIAESLPSIIPATPAASPTVLPPAPIASNPITAAPTIVAPSPTVVPTAQPIQPAPFVAVPVPQPSVSASPQPSPLPRTEFPDVPPDYWATPFITELARRGIVEGFPDTTFRPAQPVTRAEFAGMLQKAFPGQGKVQSLSFPDVPADYWGNAAISEAVQSGFMRGYPDSQFRPDQQIPKEQAIVALNTGLKLSVPDSPVQKVAIYQDANKISRYAIEAIAAATQANLVVNHPDPKFLTPELTTSRAEAAALIYQALVQRQQASPIQSEFIVQAPR